MAQFYYHGCFCLFVSVFFLLTINLNLVLKMLNETLIFKSVQNLNKRSKELFGNRSQVVKRKRYFTMDQPL